MKRDSLGQLALGLGTGLAFGFLLQKGQVAKHRKIVNQLQLTDWDVVKVMGTASAVGGLGTYLLRRGGHVEPSIKPLKLGGVVTGGVLFGAGMAILGYCPGTSVAAAGQGNRDAWAGIAGMGLGALAYVRFLPQLKRWIDWGDYGEKTVPQIIERFSPLGSGVATEDHANPSPRPPS